ncbi:phosphate transporter family protein [Eremomyces bilateralis CBS 781.70]|uniref:Phosphate transporter n=1 Tax=Eremomyces bilateralis CBS 781.70 TaxID=1392243 RepID=A0A6G1G5W2_9PEZI|nr:phosphate transporter family protein [Eremomyces bilateralis CBS 781.70]KAF1813402.1 phosphate transporter family protein [Eremomyces bilateralis CBS 781.70]
MAPALKRYDWILAIISIAFVCSSFGNGANDVANSFATSVAARTLTMPQVGVISACTEFVGAVALGSRVTSTIKNGIMNISKFENSPAVLMLVMGCAEIGSAFWLIFATSLGFPVSTTQTIVGALVGSGIASTATIKWEWSEGSVSQIAASWAIAPLISGAISAILFATLKFAILERKDPLKRALRAIPVYFAFTAGVLTLFIIVELPQSEDLENFPLGTLLGSILGVFFGILLFSIVFMVPFFHRRLVQEDSRVRIWHVPLGPLLYRENQWLYFPGAADSEIVTDYYEEGHDPRYPETTQGEKSFDINSNKSTNEIAGKDVEAATGESTAVPNTTGEPVRLRKRRPEPEERWLVPVRHLPIYHPKKLLNWLKWLALQGVSRDCITHQSEHIRKAHSLATRYDNRVEHLWTYAQVVSAMMMSIAHGSNDVANAVGPWVATYDVYMTGVVESKTDTPIWILVIAGILLGAGFWFFGYHIIRALGNRITQLSPTRGFSMELGAAITVLMASRLGLPVSTTQCLTGSVMGVALMNLSLGAVNWRQMAYILMGWMLTLPCAGLISGLLCVMALNAPHF